MALESVERAGGKAEYIQADVTDSETFSNVLAGIREKYGRVDGAIHAAGIIEDKLFRYKDAESFERVYNTKTLPLKTLLEKLLPDLKLLVMFSSISAAFGNSGQCDYAAGNSVFDSAARILGGQYPGLRVISFNWGPWIGAGMVNSALRNEILKRGLSLIEVDKGKEYFLDELKYGRESNVLTVCCDDKFVSDYRASVLKRLE